MGNLILRRKPGEFIQVGESTVSVVSIKGGHVKLAINAPEEIQIKRGPKVEPVELPEPAAVSSVADTALGRFFAPRPVTADE